MLASSEMQAHCALQGLSSETDCTPSTSNSAFGSLMKLKPSFCLFLHLMSTGAMQPKLGTLMYKTRMVKWGD